MEIIYNAWQTFTSFNQTDLAGIFVYPAHIWEGFIPLVITSLFFIVLLATFFGQQRMRGEGDIMASFAVASWFVAIISTIMTMIDLVNIDTLAITYALSIVSVGILYMRKRN